MPNFIVFLSNENEECSVGINDDKLQLYVFNAITSKDAC